MPVPFLPSSLSHITDVTPFLTCSGLMVVGHRLDCYSLLSVVFAVFSSVIPGHGSLVQDIPPFPPHSSFRCAYLQLGPVWYPARQGITPVVSPQFLAPLSMFLYCATLLSCFVFSFAWFPPVGVTHMCIKRFEGKVEDIRIISCILTHLHPYSTTLDFRLSPLLLAPSPSSSPRLRIAYLYRWL